MFVIKLQNVPGRVVITTEYFGRVLSAAKANDAKIIPCHPIPYITRKTASRILLQANASAVPEKNRTAIENITAFNLPYESLIKPITKDPKRKESAQIISYGPFVNVVCTW